MGRLGLGSGSQVVGQLGPGMRVSPSFQIISRPVGRLGLGSEPHVVGRLGSGPRVGTGGISRGIFRRGCLRGELSPGGLSHRIAVLMNPLKG